MKKKNMLWAAFVVAILGVLIAVINGFRPQDSDKHTGPMFPSDEYVAWEEEHKKTCPQCEMEIDNPDFSGVCVEAFRRLQADLKQVMKRRKELGY